MAKIQEAQPLMLRWRNTALPNLSSNYDKELGEENSLDKVYGTHKQDTKLSRKGIVTLILKLLDYSLNC